MSVSAPPGPPTRLPGRGAWNGLLGLLVAGAALLAGLALGVVGGAFGPGVVVGLPLGALLALVVLRRPSLGPALVVVSVPIGLVGLPGGLDLVQAAAAGAIGLIGLRRLIDRRAPLGWDRLLWFGVVLTAIALAGTFLAPDVELALRQDAALILALLLVCAVLAACRTVAHLRRVVWTLVVVGAGVCSSALAGASAIEARQGGQNVSNRLRGTFTEPNQFGCFSAMVLVLSIGLFLGARGGRQRLAALGCGSMALVALGLSLSRGAWIGAATALLLLLVLLPQARTWLMALSVPLVALGLSISVVTPDRPEIQVVKARVATFGNIQGNPYDGRPAIWQEARREIVDSPLLGQGPGQFPVVSVRAVSEAASVSADHAHNVLLTTSAELGLPAAAVVVAFTLAVLRRFRRIVPAIRDRRDRAVVAASASALAVVVGQGLVDFLFRNAIILLVHAVLLGLVLAVGREALRQEP